MIDSFGVREALLWDKIDKSWTPEAFHEAVRQAVSEYSRAFRFGSSIARRVLQHPLATFDTHILVLDVDDNASRMHDVVPRCTMDQLVFLRERYPRYRRIIDVEIESRGLVGLLGED